MEAAAYVPEKARVLIADDQRLFAEALEAILSTNNRIEVVGHAANGREAIDLWRELRPNVTLMDISMPVMDGFEATGRIRERDPHACILMLTGSNSRTDVDRARKAGAAGYVTKDRIAAELIDVILSMGLMGLILMHSGRDTGLGGMGFTPQSQGGTHIVERNLTRLTIVVGIIFFLNTILLFHLLS